METQNRKLLIAKESMWSLLVALFLSAFLPVFLSAHLFLLRCVVLFFRSQSHKALQRPIHTTLAFSMT